ncbi:MAG: aldehyde dehydrogenase [Alphaproteobacteria bacterium]|nr:aldehyde dehydrogenase [Alphaproteobacteria bacterium]MCB9690430.1 aldehyde dehydrogenase [Alphaproteobacteria bacterium]
MQLESLNPVTNAPVGSVEVTPVDAIPGVVAAARAAFPAWRDLGAAERGRRIAAAGPLILERLDELASLLTAEMGKPLPAARGEVRSCGAGLDEEIATIVEALEPEILEDRHTRTVLHRDPYGVCAAITPWNFPISMPHWLVIPALVAGNTVVLKPSEETPLIADAWARILQSVLPTDVLQIVHGNEQQGKALVGADVDLVAFTGSRGAGAHILSAAGGQLKRVLLELGGKDPLIVLDDADLDRAADFAARNSFRNTGQVCVSTERIYVARPLHDAFVARLVDAAAALVVGDGAQQGVDLGPMINARQKQHVVTQVEAALASGAQLAFGTPEGEGCFLPPIVLTGVDHAMDVMREETFGPVAAVQAFDTPDEAVALANDTPFGLGAVVFGHRDASSVARRLEAGMIGINRSCGGAGGSPWVGAKQSGYGFHSGPHGHRQFAQVRIVSESAS